MEMRATQSAWSLDGTDGGGSGPPEGELARGTGSKGWGRTHATQFIRAAAADPDDGSGSAHDPVDGDPAVADHGAPGADPAGAAGEPGPRTQRILRRPALRRGGGLRGRNGCRAGGDERPGGRG